MLLGNTVKFVKDSMLVPHLNKKGDDRWEECRDLEHRGKGTVVDVSINANNGRAWILILDDEGNLHHRDHAAVRVIQSDKD